MTEKWTLYARAPGGRSATLDGPHGRHVWIQGVTRSRTRRGCLNWKCATCGRVIGEGEWAFRPEKASGHVRSLRICKPCVDKMGAAEGRTGSDG